MIHYKFLSTALLLGTVMLWSSCSDIEEDFSGIVWQQGVYYKRA